MKEIRNRFSGETIYSSEVELLRQCVEKALSEGADLSHAKLSHAKLSHAKLSHAKLSGANLRGANLSRANLSRANLSGADLRGANLSSADLRGADLRGAKLRGAELSDADLSDADLSDAKLSDVELRGVPVIRNIHRSVYAAASKKNALDMSDWHTCETTHCRAGWVITLAGEAGRALEQNLGKSYAASIIYLASDPGLEKIPDFHCDKDTALADMKRLAKAEESA